MYFPTFVEAIDFAERQLMVYGQEIDPGRWQGVSTAGRPDMVTRELMNLVLDVPVRRRMEKDEFFVKTIEQLAEEIKPNLPWADDHFLERVSGVPSNPGVQFENWPWWHGQSATAMAEGEQVFDHTYQERFWPKHAEPGEGYPHYYTGGTNRGIRYEYGDLDDVVNMLFKDPLTRQATFPIFFPEDTGALHGGRIPCTLHYHFLLRNNQLHLWYPIRSCDFVRHFRDDLYMACRLMLWMINALVDKELHSDKEQVWVDVTPGPLHFTAYSFHIHKGDMHHVRKPD